MYTDDQDEEVEEEEEFHEVEEEKHKTSQDAVNDSSGNHKKVLEKGIPSASAETTDVDWANIMMRSQSKNSDLPTGADLSSNSVTLSDIPSDLKDTDKPSDDSIINNIIEETESKLKIVDVSHEPTHQGVAEDQTVGEPHVCESTAEAQTGDGTQSGSDQPRTSSQSDVSFASPNLDSSPDQQPQLGFYADEKSMPEQESPVVATKPEQTSNPLQNLEEPQIDCKDQSAPDHDSKASAEEPSPEVPVELDSEQMKADIDGTEAAELGVDEKKSEDPERKELDLDEDVKNPQYIPKKGVFYEHDDRSHDVEEKKTQTNQKEGDEVETKEVNASKRTSSQDKQAENRRTNRKQRTDADRWNHDLFRGERQKPKSKSELVNAYGYDIRQERAGRSQQSDSRQSRSGRNSNHERNITMQDGQQSRQTKDGRIQRQNQPGNRSRDRRSRRQNVSKVNQQQPRNDGPGSEIKRDATGSRPARIDARDPRDGGDKEAVAVVPSVSTNTRRDQDVPHMSRNPRNDSRGRRKSSRDRNSNNDERLPLTNTVMPPITTWSNEDMMKAEAFGKSSPSRAQNINSMTVAGSNNQTLARDRSNELWQQGQQNKTIYQDRPPRNHDESRQQSYSSRGRYQDRGDENHRPTHYLSRNQYHERNNQNHDWHRANNFGSYGKPNDYVVKTQTFENSRLSQANMGRSNNRDLREVINERRMQGQTYHNKVHHGVDHHVNSRGPDQGQLFQHQYAQPHMVMQQHHMAHNQQQSPQMLMMQSQQHQQAQQQTSRHMQMPMGPQQQASSSPQPQINSQTSQAQLTSHRQQPTTTQSQSHQVSSRQTALSGSTVEQDSARGSSSSTSTDPANSRPIIKTDAYTGNMHSHQQHAGQHSQAHRSMGGPMSQQNSATSHMVPSHLGSAGQPQYYTPSPGSRDPTANAAAVASAYHGYLPGGHAVMDAARYHMASQQLTEHGYLANPNQTGDVSGGVVHQQGMYPDTTAGGAVANSTYMAQHPSSTISPSSIPVTGAGAQLPPVPYIQHSQYPPPPYSNPYTQPQHNQGPPQSSHAYPPYWTYI